MEGKMTSRREFEGLGYHFTGYDTDCLLVERWTQRPEDLKGQAVTIGKLLSAEMRHTGHPRDVLPDEAINLKMVRKFRFRIIVETERYEE